MSFQKSKHDFGILKQDGTTKVGFILACDKNKTPIYQTFDDEYLARQQTTEAGYDALIPEKEFRIGQDSWRSGFGLETYDESDPERYYESYNMDLRNRGMAICSYKPTTLTKPTAPSAAWVSPTGFVDPDAAWTSGTNAYDTNTATYATSTPGVSTWSKFIELTITPQPTSSVRYWAQLGDQIDVDAYYNGGWHDVYQGTDIGSLWYEKSLGATYGVSKVRIRILATGAINTVYLNEVNLYFDPPAVGTTIAIAEFNDKLYASFGLYLGKLNAGGTGFDLVKTFPVTITDLEVFSDSKLYIELGYSNAYWEMTTAEAFTENTLANNSMKFLKMVHLTADTMYGSDTVNTIRSTTTPQNGGAVAWTAQTIVDTSFNNITNVLDVENALYIMKEDRPFYLDSSGNVDKLTEATKHLTNSTGGKNTVEWLGGLYMPYKAALLEYLDGTFTWLNPSDYCTNLSAFAGDVQAVAGDERYLLVALGNGTKIEIMAGRRETINGTTSWVWHPHAELTLDGVETMFVSSVYQKRLWIASTLAGDSLYYIPLPTSYGSIATDANRSFATDSSQYFVTPWMHANFKGDSKAFIKMTLTMSGTTANIYFTVEYQLKGSTNWTTIGAFKTSPTTTNYIPVDDVSGANPVSTMIRFKITATTNSATTTPILYGYDCRGILYPTRRDIIYCEVRCADNITLNDGGHDRDTDAGVIKATLEEAKNTATWPVTFYDIDGTTIYVRFLPTKPFSYLTKDEISGKVERRFRLLLQKVTLS